jgi:hypothetical protein
MKRVQRTSIVGLVALLTVTADARAAVRAQQTAAASPLKIVVLEGEGAVNIIQQKTAVAPVVEVRDRNDQPVSGVVVRFAIQKGRATFNGARTLSVTTDAAGRAAAAGLTPTGSGPLHIAASAAFQGQTAAAAIAQTTVMTAAEATSVAAGAGGASVGGGGLSSTAIAGIAGAGIAGAVLASKLTSSQNFAGPFNGQIVVTTSVATPLGTSACASTRSITGTLTIRIDEGSDGSVTGRASTRGTMAETGVTQAPTCSANFGTVPFDRDVNISGTANNVSFEDRTSSSSTSPATVMVTTTLAFTGRLEGDVITGVLTYGEVSNGQQLPPFNGTINGSGTTAIPVTLR